MTNNSGKFKTGVVSNKSVDAKDDDKLITGQPNVGSEDPSDDNFPPMPEDNMSKVRRLFGEWWWLWIVAVVFYISNRK